MLKNSITYMGMVIIPRSNLQNKTINSANVIIILLFNITVYYKDSLCKSNMLIFLSRLHAERLQEHIIFRQP
jgi:hypothetical protein